MSIIRKSFPFVLAAYIAHTDVLRAASPGSCETMTDAELKQAVARCPVAYLPVGINEWHGEQSACGLDALKAETLCRMAASSLGGVCFPTLWLGPDASTPFDPATYPRGTLTIPQDLYFRAAEELLARIEAQGFRVCVWLSGHYPGVIPSVAARFNERGTLRVISISENMVVQGIPCGDHAAAWETSVLMVLRPGLVDLSRLPPLPATTRPAGDVITPPYEFRQCTEFYGVYGADPRIWANPLYGRRGTEAVLDGLVREVGKALGEVDYGKARPPVAWPPDTRQPPEVRYDHQLPREWLRRYDEAPVVYWPLPGGGDSVDAVTAGAVALARSCGGMVFPALAYGPGAAARMHLSPETWRQIVREHLSDFREMAFRVIVLMPGPGLDADLVGEIGGLRQSDGQTRILVARPGDAAGSEAVRAAVRRMVPQGPEIRALDDGWLLHGKPTAMSLSAALYGPPGDTRIYERRFDLTEDEARMAVVLDLGTVSNWCELRINDTPPLEAHWRPYRFVLTGRVQAGANRLKVTVRHKPQPGLDAFFYRAGPPELKGPVTLKLWRP